MPGFGDPLARLLILGLAPGAHGSNRTGRMFTGDRSGDMLYARAPQNRFRHPSRSAFRGTTGWRSRTPISPPRPAALRPATSPRPRRSATAGRSWSARLDLLPNVKVVVALGRIAFDNYLDMLKSRGAIRSRAEFAFGHNRQFRTAEGQPALISSYHPSQQNTSTGKLTEKMLLDVFRRARRIMSRARKRRPVRERLPPRI